MDPRLVAVAVPLPFQSPFTYRLLPDQPGPERGCRVLVPFGGRRVIGVVTGPGQPVPGAQLKDVAEVVDESPLVAPPLLDLAAWMADYYLAAPGECFRLVLPPLAVRASRAVVRLRDASVAPDDPVVQALGGGAMPVARLARRLGRDPSARLHRLHAAGAIALEQDLGAPGFREVRVVHLHDPAAVPRGKAQAEVLRRLADAGGALPLADLVRERPALRGAVARLLELGTLRSEDVRELRAPSTLSGAVRGVPEATPDQQAALQSIAEAIDGGGYAPFLLHGVTGSGKTEVYFRAAQRVLDAGRGALLLVPEIALTPMLVRAATARFGSTVSVLHSELSAGERHDQWWRIREGGARLVIGARSAVFAPVLDLGLIVVDEEHEGSYKQEERPRYHARDVAVVRATLEGAAVVLGSATPSVESQANAVRGKYRRLALPRRIGAQGLPTVEVVDRREVLKQKGDLVLTPPLLAALQERLVRGEQALLLLNRRGYATSLLCRECGVPASCPNCSVALTMHDGGRNALCHYCGHETGAPSRCANCRGEYLRLTGFGTERVLERLRAALPSVRAERLDRDLASRRGQVERVLSAFEAGELDVLVGTQMIAKGHDFPRVTLVGVIDADVGLGMPDFRAAERTYQLLTQVSGRAGRADLKGEVILQSHLPDHYSLRLACAQDYDGFFATEMEFRRTMGYPPHAALLNLVVHAPAPAPALRTARDLAERLRASAGGRYRVLGPAHAPLARLRQEHRVQILLKGDRTAMRRAVRQALVAAFGETRWPGVMVDVDPISVM